MTNDQFFLFSLFGTVFALLIWGRIRYDMVAFGALVIAVIGGFVTPDQAFSGFGHPAVVTVAAILILSRALQGSGLIESAAVLPDAAPITRYPPASRLTEARLVS